MSLWGRRYFHGLSLASRGAIPNPIVRCVFQPLLPCQAPPLGAKHASRPSDVRLQVQGYISKILSHPKSCSCKASAQWIRSVRLAS